jgi:Predicted transcriptional regulator with C-terminal CBS domains
LSIFIISFFLLPVYFFSIIPLIKARNERGISQRELEELSGVKQPVISRMESGTTSPQLETVMKILAPLGKTLAVVPIEIDSP